MSLEEIQESRNWKIKKQDGSRLEPANLDVLREWVTSGQIGMDDLVINDDLASWVPASEIPELSDLFGGQAIIPDTSEASPDDAIHRPAKAGGGIEMPDCAFHPGQTASKICVGCGKFVCEECCQRLDRKVLCRVCVAEKQAGIEPGAPVGPGAPAEAIPGASPGTVMSRLAVASLIFSVVALLALTAMLVSGFLILPITAAGFFAFWAALLGGISLSRIRLSERSLRGRELALAGLLLGCVILTGSIAGAYVFTMKTQAMPGRKGVRQVGSAQLPPGRRQNIFRRPERRQLPAGVTKQVLQEHEASARQLLEEARGFLSQGQLQRALNICRTIDRLYPESETAKLIRRSIPVMEQALAKQQSDSESLAQENEEAAQQKYELAINLYSDGDRGNSLELLKGIVIDYRGTNVAEQARTEISKIEKELADEELQRLEEEASKLAAQADERMDAENFEEAAELYGKIVNEYPQTLAASRVRTRLKQAELIVKDASERAFYGIQKEIEIETYEEAIALLRNFQMQFPDSSRMGEVEQLLAENQKNKMDADNLYNFGRAHFVERKYRIALGRYGKLIREYPRSHWIPQAKEENREALERLQE
jgi:tetratricopeptide (TPR) repeat protein